MGKEDPSGQERDDAADSAEPAGGGGHEKTKACPAESQKGAGTPGSH